MQRTVDFTRRAGKRAVKGGKTRFSPFSALLLVAKVAIFVLTRWLAIRKCCNHSNGFEYIDNHVLPVALNVSWTLPFIVGCQLSILNNFNNLSYLLFLDHQHKKQESLKPHWNKSNQRTLASTTIGSQFKTALVWINATEHWEKTIEAYDFWSNNVGISPRLQVSVLATLSIFHELESQSLAAIVWEC